MLPVKVIERVMSLARQSSREICGVIDDQGTVYPIRNVSNASNAFIMDKREYFRTLKTIEEVGATIECIYHSHVACPPTPSPADLAAVKRLRKSYLIVNSSTYEWVPYEP